MYELQNQMYLEKSNIYQYKQCKNCNYTVIDYGKPYEILMTPKLQNQNSALFIICTQPSEKELRDLFRLIIKYYQQKYNIQYLFTLTKDDNIPRVKEKLLMENEQYKDMLVFNHTNNYQNLALTVLLTYHYINQINLNFKYIVKTDADCAINIDLLMKLLYQQELLRKSEVYIGDCFKSTFSNKHPKHYVPREIVSENPVVESVARGGLYILSSNMIPRILISTRHLPFLTHQEDLTVGRALNRLGYKCENMYKKWISRYGCKSYCEKYIMIHPQYKKDEIYAYYNIFLRNITQYHVFYSII